MAPFFMVKYSDECRSIPLDSINSISCDMHFWLYDRTNMVWFYASWLCIFLKWSEIDWRYNGTNGSEYSLEENLNLPVFFFMSVIVALFMGLTISAEEIIRDRKILKREAFLNLSRLSYLLSKILILFGISLIQTLSFVLISNWILEVQDMNIINWMILFCFNQIKTWDS